MKTQWLIIAAMCLPFNLPLAGFIFAVIVTLDVLLAPGKPAEKPKKRPMQDEVDGLYRLMGWDKDATN
jgi:hypothetical protein